MLGVGRTSIVSAVDARCTVISVCRHGLDNNPHISARTERHEERHEIIGQGFPLSKPLPQETLFNCGVSLTAPQPVVRVLWLVWMTRCIFFTARGV